jgi:hypothetical protein
MVDLTFIWGKRHEKFQLGFARAKSFSIFLFFFYFFPSERCQETTLKLYVDSDLRTRLKSGKVVLPSSL